VEFDRERSYVPCNGCGDESPAFLFQDAELAVAGRRFGLVAEPLADVQGPLVPVGGLLVVPAVLGEQAETVVGGGHFGLVAEPLADVQGALVLPGGLLVVPADLGEHAELVVASGYFGLVAEPLNNVKRIQIMSAAARPDEFRQLKRRRDGCRGHGYDDDQFVNNLGDTRRERRFSGDAIDPPLRLAASA
jgi:hypothetical protein